MPHAHGGIGTDVTACMAYAYMVRHWRLNSAVHGITSSARAWRNLDAAAARTRIRVILAPWFRKDEPPRCRLVDGWRFPDKSHLVHFKRAAYPAAVEVLRPDGVVAGVMRDTTQAISTVLRGSGLPVYETLACAYLDVHGGLPAVDRDALLCALQAQQRVIRLAAIAGLGCMGPG